MKKLLVAVLFLLGIICARTGAAVAQEAGDDKFSFGKVVSVTASEITVKEYDFAKDEDVQVAYSVTPETELGNVNAVTDLQVDDDIVIDYTERDGKRVVTTLVKEEKGADALFGEGTEGDANMAADEPVEPAVEAPEAAPAE